MAISSDTENNSPFAAFNKSDSISLTLIYLIGVFHNQVDTNHPGLFANVLNVCLPQSPHRLSSLLTINCQVHSLFCNKIPGVQIDLT